ncbi:FUSC family protein [Mammaliicoccus stepanovicii]|uniref:Membrane protein n=1 Tax=Mammaliicoccus stepanovicii TaxID=643214 RepID=A0A239YUT0_9STAP|nr:aromatic acid exporter family protein [Mammaliicoccus stepanovicii]PNZ73502.1 aromatic acid exporter family protein [Mammaliicoccus stepanovicii]GGI42220.1 membrane protein [Mammaliicoccus stepanovicii]SNV62517.1 membrane protein [Mammaliicoccus stepanovicii]
MKFGARIFKTGIAIVLAIFLANLLPGSSMITTLAGVTAMVAMQPSVYRSFKTVVEQFQGNVIGALTAVAIFYIFGNHVVFIGLTAVIIISILYKFNLQHVSNLAVVTALIILGTHNGEFYMSAIYRFSLVMIGVLSAFIVNFAFLPPKFETKMYYNSLNISTDIFKWFRLVLNGTTEFHYVKQDLETIRTRIVKLEQFYLYYKEERAYTKKESFSQMRKKILFKEIITTTRRAFEVLRKMNRYENDILNLDDNFKVQMKFELDELMAHHEQILVRISQKAKHELTQVPDYLVEPFKEDLVEIFIKEITDNPNQNDYYIEHVMQVISAMLDYKASIQHLDRLSASFFKYHSDDSEIQIDQEDFDL